MIQKTVKGNIHQGSSFLQDSLFICGSQCTSIAVIAFLLATFENVKNWLPHHLDNLVVEGSLFYHQIVNDNFNGNTSRYLEHNELPSQFYAYDTYHSLNITNTYFGITSNVNTVQWGGHSFSEAIIMSFSN